MKTRSIYLLIALIVFLTATDARAEGEVDIEPRAGVIIPQGTDLDDVSPLLGVQADWDIDDTFNLRFGYEYAKIDVTGGSDLALSRIPVMITVGPNMSKSLSSMYIGFGGVYTNAHYSDGHHPDVGKLGPVFMIGAELNNNFKLELAYDHMKRYGRNYGGYTFAIVYEGF